MNIDVIHSEERGSTETKWLMSRHTYSFGKYLNLSRLNFGTLRVVNDDIVQPGKGFETHSHENMEIVTIVLSGALRHRDNQHHEGILKEGDIQRMSAGSGIEHSEMNASSHEPVHFLQIWIHPEKWDIDPSYEQKHFPKNCFKNTLFPIVSKGSFRATEENTPLYIHQDVTFYLGEFEEVKEIVHKLRKKNRGIYLFVIEGKVSIGAEELTEGDSAQVTHVDEIYLKTKASSKLLLIEVDVNTL